MRKSVIRARQSLTIILELTRVSSMTVHQESVAGGTRLSAHVRWALCITYGDMCEVDDTMTHDIVRNHR